MDPDELDENAQSPLPQDGDTPFTPATSPQDDTAEDNLPREIDVTHLDDTHPSTDTNVDPMEAYDEGLPGAAEASEPNAGNAVIDKEDE
jgi:hypothetical protein